RRNIRFTTSEDFDNPEYYFQSNKLKLFLGNNIVIAVTIMVIAVVSTPIALPFAFFKMSKDAVSGFIIPSFGDNNQRGYYIQNGGYYFAFSDRLDLTVLGDYYTNGSHALSARSTYAQRYKYRGDVNIRYEQMINSEFGFPD